MSLQIITLSCTKMDSIDQLKTNITSLIYGVIVLENAGKVHLILVHVRRIGVVLVRRIGVREPVVSLHII